MPGQITPYRRLEFFAVSCMLVMLSGMAFGITTEQAWSNEYDEAVFQINRLKTSGKVWRDRLATQALDPQALVCSADKDPLDVALRRTGALLQFFKKNNALPASAMEAFETTFNTLASETNRVSEAEER